MTLRNTLLDAMTGEVTMSDLTVLAAQRDPYRLDTPRWHELSAWLVAEWSRLDLPAALHPRGIHYALSQGKSVKPNGEPYILNGAHWELIQLVINAARWLGYIEFDDITDRRNVGALVRVADDVERQPAAMTKSNGGTLWLPETVAEIEPTAEVVAPVVRQPFRLVLAGEKSSLALVLEPLAAKYDAELVLPTGMMSLALINGILARAAADGRPCVVFYFADFDPSGWSMPISFARSAQALIEAFHPGVELRVIRVAMTKEIIERHGLEDSALSDEESRNEKWTKHWGIGQVEIDALATLDPDALIEIAEQAIAPFFDDSIEAQVEALAEEQAQRAAEIVARANARHRPQLDALQPLLDAARQAVALVADALEEVEAEIEDDVADELAELADDISSRLPVPETCEQLADTLFDTDRDWLRSTEMLKREQEPSK